MKRTSRILGADGNNLVLDERPVRNLQAGYDILQNRTSTDTFALVNSLNANALDTRERRRQLRDLARYEVRNNPHLKGLSERITNETIGKGPRISIEPLATGERKNKAANRAEALWNESADETEFVENLKLMDRERRTGGETFTVWHPNPVLETVPMGHTVYEGDQFQTPEYEQWTADQTGNELRNDGPIDGMVQDRWGNIVEYHRMRYHPNGRAGLADSLYGAIDHVDASVCFHWFQKDRPSKYRGTSEVQSALWIYNSIRRFIESKVTQEGLRAKLLGQVRTKFAPDAGCADIGDEPIDMLIGDGQFTSMPDGWEVEFFKFDPTGQNVKEFVDVMLGWASQALLAPWNIVSNNSSDYNFASGRLDHTSFFNYIDMIRDYLERTYLKRYFRAWSSLAMELRRWPADLGAFKVVWHWDKREPIDPLKQANADVKLKDANLLDEVDYARRQGDNALDRKRRQFEYEAQALKLKQEIYTKHGVEIPTERIPENQDAK